MSLHETTMHRANHDEKSFFRLRRVSLIVTLPASFVGNAPGGI